MRRLKWLIFIVACFCFVVNVNAADKCDADGDGKVNIADVYVVKEIVSGKKTMLLIPLLITSIFFLE